MPNTMDNGLTKAAPTVLTITENLETNQKLIQEGLAMVRDIVEKLDGPKPQEPSPDKIPMSDGIIGLSQKNNMTMNELLCIIGGIRASM